jgi:hypothetical protein
MIKDKFASIGAFLFAVWRIIWLSSKMAAHRVKMAWRAFSPLLKSGFRQGLAETGAHLRLDRWIVPLLLVAMVALVPLVPRSTGSALKLAAFINDEPALTMNLHAMTLTPIGDPWNLDAANPRRKHVPGPEWSGLTYGGFNYYGGLYLGAGFLAYAPLKLFGAPIFPTAPFILRLVSMLAALGSLILIYQFGRRNAGVLAGAAAALVLATDVQFLYYGSIIHPDSLQLFMGLIGLILAALHLREKSFSTLIALGIAMGMSQSTKVGAIWFIPTACLAVWWGLPQDMTGWRDRLKGSAARMLALGLTAIAAWFITTPYAVFGSYLSMMRGTWTVVTSPNLGAGQIMDWIKGFRTHFGTPLALLLAAATCWTVAKAVKGWLSRPLVLALVLAVSQILWFVFSNKVWVIVGYCMLAYGLLGMFAAMMLKDIFKIIQRNSRAVSRLALWTACLFLGGLVLERTLISSHYILRQYLRDQSTSIKLDDWAKANNLPSSAKIRWDDIAYLDPLRFPNGRMHGGLMSWSALRIHDPDYVVLSSSIFESSWYANLITTQNLGRTDAFVYNVRLYQDFLGTKNDGKPVPPWVQAVHSISATPAEKHNPPLWLVALGDTVPHIGKPFVKGLIGFDIHLWTFRHLFENAIGLRNDLFGPTLKIFRLNGADEACGREQVSETGGTLEGYQPAFAFDGTSAAWVSAKIGKAAEGVSIAVNFGCGEVRGGSIIDILWATAETRPHGFRIEASQDGKEWINLGDFSTRDDPPFVTGKANRYVLSQSVRAQRWRFTVTQMPEKAFMGIADIVIPE